MVRFIDKLPYEEVVKFELKFRINLVGDSGHAAKNSKRKLDASDVILFSNSSAY